MLLIDYAKKYGKAASYLTLLAQKGNLPFVKKIKVYRVEKNRRGKYYEKERFMWAVEDEEALTAFLQKKKEKVRSIFRDGWTRSSLECYKARLICSNCPNYAVCKNIVQNEHLKKPPIKNKTIELVRTYGTPPERINEE